MILLASLVLIFVYVLLTYFDKRKAFLLLPLFFITALLKFQIGPLNFSVLEVFIWIIFIAHIFQLKTVILPFTKFIRKPASLVFLFFLVATVSLLVVPKQLIFQTGILTAPTEVFETMKVALGIWKGWIVPMVLFSLVYELYTMPRIGKVMMETYFLGAFFVAAISLLLRFTLGYEQTIDGRLGVLFVSANYLVFYLAPAFLFGLIHTFEVWKEMSEGFWSRMVKWWNPKQQLLRRKDLLLHSTMLLVILVALFLAESYASWLSILLCLAIGIMISGKRYLVQRRAKIAIAVGVVLLVSGFFLSQSHTLKWQKFFETQQQSSTSTRLEVYQVAMAILQEHWVTGIGMGQFESVYKLEAPRILGTAPYEWVMLHPHNLYISLWLSMGVFGFLIFLWMLSDALRNTWKPQSMYVLLPLLYIMLHGVVDTPFWKMDAMMIFLLIFLVASRKDT